MADQPTAIVGFRPAIMEGQKVFGYILVRVEDDEAVDTRSVFLITEKGETDPGPKDAVEGAKPLTDGTWYAISLDEDYHTPRYVVETVQKVTRQYDA